MDVDHLQSIIDYVRNSDHLYKFIYEPNLLAPPIPYFGDIGSARILTVGVNPAASEFKRKRSWPNNPPIEYLARRLQNYFHLDSIPPHEWFNTWEKALNTLDSSYYTHDAAHLDLSPRATINMGEMPDSDTDLFLEMVKADMRVFLELLPICKQAKLLIIAGAVTKRFYINEFIHRHSKSYGFELRREFKPAKNPGAGKTFYHQIIGGSINLPVFFCSVSPSARNNNLLVDRIQENRDALIRLMSDRS